MRIPFASGLGVALPSAPRLAATRQYGGDQARRGTDAGSSDFRLRWHKNTSKFFLESDNL
jgi:hypothetical protein